MTSDLITRLSKLDAPDREVDAEIARSIGGLKANREFGMGGNWWDRWTDNGFTVGLPEYTASVDAAIALAARVLPGWKWRVGKTELFPNGWAYVHKYDPSNCDRKDEAACADGRAANPAIALCIALLRAKEANKL